MKYNLTKSKVWQIIGVSVLCAVCVLGAVLGVLFGVKNPNTEIIPSTDMSDKPDDSVIIDTDSEQGISLLMGTATTAADGSTTQTITATIEPSYAPNQKVDWSVSFKNAESTWAKNKTVTDYVTVTPTADGALTADIACVKAFGEQIIVTCTSRDDTSVKATATVDYRKKITMFLGLNVMADGEVIHQYGQLPFSDSGKEITFEFRPVYSDYTVDDTFTAILEWKVADDFYTQVNLESFVHQTSDKLRAKTSFSTATSITMNLQSIIEFAYNYSNPVKEVKNYVIGKLLDYTGKFLDLKVTYSSQYSSRSSTAGITVGAKSWSATVSSISFDNSSLIF